MRNSLALPTGSAVDGLPNCPLVFANSAAVVFHFVIQNVCPPFCPQRYSIVFGNAGHDAEICPVLKSFSRT
jgi:hypothetical protein